MLDYTNFIIGDKIWVIFLRRQEPVDKVLFFFELGEILHALHEALHSKACRNGEVIKLVDFSQVRVLPEKFVKCRNLADLSIVSS